MRMPESMLSFLQAETDISGYAPEMANCCCNTLAEVFVILCKI